jgi:hypothetical protein
MEFILRVKKGITLEMARIIDRRTQASGLKSCHLLVSLEGLYGSSPRAEDFDSVVLMAGGSGITHVASILEDVCERAEKGQASTTDVTLVWAVRHLGELAFVLVRSVPRLISYSGPAQARWIETALVKARAAAQRAGIDLAVRIFVTRSEAQLSAQVLEKDSCTIAGGETPLSTPGLDEKKEEGPAGQPVTELGGAVVSRIRPNVAHEVSDAVSRARGQVLVVGESSWPPSSTPELLFQGSLEVVSLTFVPGGHSLWS